MAESKAAEETGKKGLGHQVENKKATEGVWAEGTYRQNGCRDRI